MSHPADIEPSTVIPSEVVPEDSVEIGQWWWVKEKKRKEWLGCVTHIGSNYFEVTSIRNSSIRVHFDEWDSICRREADPEGYISSRVAHYQKQVRQLMGEVKEVTARLGVGASPELSDGTASIVKATSDRNYETYSKDLVKAKQKTLPDLFSLIEDANEAMASWMKAPTVPMKAQAQQLKGVISQIEDRIFNVELYAGLVEKVVRIKEGAAAPIDAKVHLLQRRCYMDEECLAQYETGGMDFKNLREFDHWLAKPDHLNRILPFPRCIVSFRVRRESKTREWDGVSHPLIHFINVVSEEAADKSTFLYIKNGEQLYRMSTAINFGEKLFPDMKYKLGNTQSGELLWAESFGGGAPDRVITDSEYRAIIAKHEREVAEWEKERAAYEAALKSPEAKRRAKEQGLKKPDHSCVDISWPSSFGPGLHRNYEPYSPDNVMFDDISNWIKNNLEEHNRIALILQGLLDRSPVLHPHPPWQIWTNEGFAQALELVYDETRTLTTGKKPDFETYRKRLNTSLRMGSLTVGQEDAWLLYEGAKEAKRYRSRGGAWLPSRHKPYGNPGPGTVARVSSLKRNGHCVFRWQRKATNYGWGTKKPFINTSFECSPDVLLHVDAYTPGDFHLFFDDPRTRAEYLQWAPLLLEAEEYHAGNRKVGDSSEE